MSEMFTNVKVTFDGGSPKADIARYGLVHVTGNSPGARVRIAEMVNDGAGPAKTVDRLTDATIERRGNTVTIRGVSDILKNEVGLASDEALLTATIGRPSPKRSAKKKEDDVPLEAPEGVDE